MRRLLGTLLMLFHLIIHVHLITCCILKGWMAVILYVTQNTGKFFEFCLMEEYTVYWLKEIFSLSPYFLEK